jgi:hypothetical protein
MERESRALGHEARSAIAELVGRYAHLADYGEVADWVTLFCEDASVARPGLKLRGREELANYLTRRRREVTVRHQLVNVVVDGCADEARAECYAQIVEVGTPPRVLLTARYRYRVVPTPEGWRIAEVSIEPDIPPTRVETPGDPQHV